jgi:hypothetical protein
MSVSWHVVSQDATQVELAGGVGSFVGHEQVWLGVAKALGANSCRHRVNQRVLPVAVGASQDRQDVVDDLADQREADDPLGEGTNVDVGQGRREKGAPSEPPVPDSWCSPVTLASKSAGRHRRVRRVNRSTGRQVDRPTGQQANRPSVRLGCLGGVA